MKVTVKQGTPLFKPIVVTLVIETEAELRELTSELGGLPSTDTADKLYDVFCIECEKLDPQ